MTRGRAAAVAVISQDPVLLERAGDAVAAAGLSLLPCQDASEPGIAAARTVLVGIDAAERLGRGEVPRRTQALVIGADGQEAALWRAAGEFGCAAAVGLPSGSAWLVRWLHDRALGPSARRTVIAAVFSAAGGVGASTLAAGLAVTAAQAGLRPLLIDAHPGPAGVDLLLGATEAADHWRRFAGIRGFLDPGAVADLPVLEGVRCLGWAGRSEAPLWQGALGSVVAAAGRDHDLVVVDGGLHAGSLQELPRSARPLLVAPASWRGAMAARPRLAALRSAFDEPPLVVLRDVGGKSDPRVWLREFEGCRALLLGFDPGVIDDEEQCRPPGTRARSSVARVCRDVLGWLGELPAAA